MASQFSKEGQYFAQITSEGKIKVWDTSTSTLRVEFTPDFHLTTPCTCLHFVEPNPAIHHKGGFPRKKIRRKSEITSTVIALGTTSGSLLGYSIAKGCLDFTIRCGGGQPISCITWQERDLVYTGGEQTITCWDLVKKEVRGKWKAGNDKITAILVMPYNKHILTASKNIKLWDIKKREVLKTFTGHSSEVTLLKHINPQGNEYFISGSKGDRNLSCWNLDLRQNDCNAAATFQTEDVPTDVSISLGSDGNTNMAVTVRNGVVHIYKHTLNGKCAKPLKPKQSLQVASDSGQDKIVAPIPIVAALLQDDMTVVIGHGNALILTFENVMLSKYEKMQCLVRKHPSAMAAAKEKQVSKVKMPVVDESVQYLTPHTTSAAPMKRKGESSGKLDIPMEKRLENLTLSKTGGDSKVGRVDNVAQLLVQGIHSKDKNLLKNALCRKDEQVIRNSVKRLPIQVIEPFVQELTTYIQGKTAMSAIGAVWLKAVLQIHAGLLVSRPDLADLLGPAQSSMESRLTLQAPLSRLVGRLEILMAQISGSTDDENIESEPIAVFIDRDDNSDSGAEGMNALDSENDWMDEDEDLNNEGGDTSESDEDQEGDNDDENVMMVDGSEEEAESEDSD